MEPIAAPLAADEHRTINRELSWLDFNSRVLSLAEDRDLPLLERVKFAAIFARNLDEFFMIRVSGLQEQVRAGIGVTAPDGVTPREQLRAIRSQAEEALERIATLTNEELSPGLEKEGIRTVDWESISAEDRAALEVTFYDRIFPVLTPLSVDPAHPFPYISSLSLNLAAIVRDPDTGLRRFARVKVPPLLPRFVTLDDGERLMPLETLIAAQLRSLFPGMEIVEHHPFRVTRDADHDIEEDEADDLLGAVQSVIRRRQRAAKAVRLEVHETMPGEIRTLLMRELELSDEDVYLTGTMLDIGGLMELYALDRPELKEDPWPPVTQPRLAESEGNPPNIFRVLREGDLLVHHPYDSFSTSVESFVEQAAEDPKVLAIKQTLYRTSGQESRILEALSRAAETGKQVVALVELTARFDEATNIDWARALETAGVHVVYGVVGLKTHAKSCLVVRNESDGIRRYAHLATGNYNEKTARLYEDVGLLTADEAIGRDVTDLFNFLTGYSRQREFRKLLIAPSNLRAHITELIGRETKPGGRITLKCNSIVDPDMIEALYAASAAGASIDLIVRGICCLRAGVPGLSERIRVRSIVGRFLEHSRIYRFGQPGSADYYISSADLMQRNLDRRVESATPITEPALTARLDAILDAGLTDDVLAWTLGPDDEWTKVPTVKGISTQRLLFDTALERAAGS